MAHLSGLDANTEYPSLPDYSAGGENSIDLFKRIVRVVRGIMNGKTNNTGSVTLTVGTATTDVNLAEFDLSPKTIIILSPAFVQTTTPPAVNANTASEFLGGLLYVSAMNPEATASGGLAKYSFRITHANNANADRYFRFFLIG